MGLTFTIATASISMAVFQLNLSYPVPPLVFFLHMFQLLVNVLHPNKNGHFGDALPSQPLD